MSAFNTIRDLCKDYVDDPLCVFGSFDNYIIVMKKISPVDPHVGLNFPEDTPVSMIYGTVTNENRPNIVDPVHAQYNASKLTVLLIIDISNLNNKQQITQKIYRRKKVYKNVFTVGEVIASYKSKLTIGKVSTHGIEYYKTIETAYSNIEDDPPNFTGCYMGWHDNGQKYYEVELIDGERSGRWTAWHIGGQKESEGEYIAGKQSGRWNEWDESGNVLSEIEYTCDEKSEH